MKKNLLLLFISCSLGIVVLEAGLRVLNPFGLRVRGTTIHLERNVRHEIENDRIPGIDESIVHTKNSLGFRGPEPPMAYQSYLKILFFGGSTTECIFLTDGKDWPAILAGLIAGDFERVWANNAGMDGHSTFGHLVLLEEHAARLEPDLAVFMIGMNDTHREDLNEFDVLLKEGHRVGSAGNPLVERSMILSLAVGLRRQVTAKRLGLGHSAVDVASLDSLTNSPETVGKSMESEAPYRDAYRRRVESILRVCEEQGIRAVLVTQPALYGLRGTIDPATGVDLGSIAVHKKVSGHWKWLDLEGYNDVVREVSARSGIPLIDLARMMPKDSRLFYDLIHFNNEGARKVAELMYRELSPYMAREFSRYRTVPPSGTEKNRTSR